MKIEVKYYPTSNNCKVPTKSTSGSAGYDLYAAEKKEIFPWSNASISLDFKIAISIGFFGKIFSRSGLCLKENISAVAGVIGSDYRGIVKVILFNDSDKKFSVEVGQRIAQMVFLEKFDVEFTCVQVLSETDRQISGFGSSGIF